MKKKRFVFSILYSTFFYVSLNAQQVFIPGSNFGNSLNNNVGIGLNLPVSRLNIGSHGTSGLLQLNYNTSFGPAASNIGDEEGGSSFISPDFAFRIFNSNITTGHTFTSFTIQGNGKTQIGDFLGVFGNSQLNVRKNLGVYLKSSQYLKMTFDNSSMGASIIWNSSQNGGGDYLSFRYGNGPNSTSLLTLSPSGQLGLGTTNFLGDYKFFVGGKIVAEELNAKLEINWPDYVFNSDYKMMTNENLRVFIKSNGHLPRIPRAEEIEKSGIDIAKTEVLLLEQIEELTLRILALDDRIKFLESQLDTKR